MFFAQTALNIYPQVSGTASWGALRSLDAVRIGHGVRCLEDPEPVAELRSRQIPLEVSVSSNVYLHVAPDFEHHPLPILIQEGLYVTLNSDGPAMFNITLTDEFMRAAQYYGFDESQLEQLVMNAAQAALLPAPEKQQLIERLMADYRRLRGNR